MINVIRLIIKTNKAILFFPYILFLYLWYLISIRRELIDLDIQRLCARYKNTFLRMYYLMLPSRNSFRNILYYRLLGYGGYI